jgi:hypothetical protein
MATIFPISASVGQQFQGYSYSGTAWEIIGEDWKPNTYSPSPPDYAESGFIWIDSDEDIEEINLAQYVTASGYHTLSNKAISGSSNYLSEIPQSAIVDLESNLSLKQDIVSGVSNTEIGYLDGVTSGIQSQLDSKLASSSASTTYLTQSNASTLYLTSSNPVITGVTSINAIEESITLAATSASGVVVYDILSNNAITYYTSNASANWTLNVRGNSGTTLNSILSTGQSLTIAFAVTNGSTAYYQTALQIDGSSITPKWQGGSSPTSGNTNSIDIYSITIIKTGNAAFTVWESQTKFA